MTKQEFESIVNLHTLSCKLKNTLRKGWLNWKVENVRIESFAEHIFSTCMIAIGFLATIEHNLDINKIITMIMIHETEEIIIGDITMFDFEELKTKKEKRRQAVLEIFKDFPNAEYFIDIIEEYEGNETPEAKFAKQCDKLDADLQARLYEGNYNLAKVEDRFYQDYRTIDAINNGFDTVSEQFLQFHINKYSDDFLDFAKHLENLELSEKDNYNKMKNKF